MFATVGGVLLMQMGTLLSASALEAASDDVAIYERQFVWYYRDRDGRERKERSACLRHDYRRGTCSGRGLSGRWSVWSSSYDPYAYRPYGTIRHWLYYRIRIPECGPRGLYRVEVEFKNEGREPVLFCALLRVRSAGPSPYAYAYFAKLRTLDPGERTKFSFHTVPEFTSMPFYNDVALFGVRVGKHWDEHYPRFWSSK